MTTCSPIPLLLCVRPIAASGTWRAPASPRSCDKTSAAWATPGQPAMTASISPCRTSAWPVDGSTMPPERPGCTAVNPNFRDAAQKGDTSLEIVEADEPFIQLGTQAAAGGRLAPVALDLDFKEAFGSQSIEAYERLLRKVIAGRLDLFARFDEQRAAWSWVMPILESWAQHPETCRPYAAGTWGPPAASALTAREGITWPEER